jgi:hypothetical protein
MAWNESRRDQSDTEERREVLPASVLETSNMVNTKDLNENILISTNTFNKLRRVEVMRRSVDKKNEGQQESKEILFRHAPFPTRRLTNWVNIIHDCVDFVASTQRFYTALFDWTVAWQGQPTEPHLYCVDIDIQRDFTWAVHTK